MPIIGAGTGRTVGDIVDRVFRDWLHPSDDQPIALTLTSDVTASATSWSYTDATLAPDEESMLASGVLVEAGTELVRVTDVDDISNNMTVVRAANGTTAASHAAGAEMRVAPTYSRRVVFDAVCDNVVALYPSLWREATTTVTTASTHIEVPAETLTITRFRYTSGSRYVTGTAELLSDFPPSSTGKAIMVYGVPPGVTAYVSYRSRFARPTAEADDLQTLGVDETWERIVVVGAAAQVVAGRDLDPVTAEFITEQLEREAYPAGSAARTRDSMLRYYQFLIGEASRNLRADNTVPVVVQV